MLCFLAGNCAFIPEIAGLWLWIAAVTIVCVMSGLASGLMVCASGVVIGMDRLKLPTPHLVLLSGT